MCLGFSGCGLTIFYVIGLVACLFLLRVSCVFVRVMFVFFRICLVNFRIYIWSCAVCVWSFSCVFGVVPYMFDRFSHGFPLFAYVLRLFFVSVLVVCGLWLVIVPVSFVYVYLHGIVSVFLVFFLVVFVLFRIWFTLSRFV